MAIVKNKTTAENRAFWEHAERVAEEVRHWPKWAGGKGVEPRCCPTCERPLEKTAEQRVDELLIRKPYMSRRAAETVVSAAMSDTMQTGGNQ
jgi:hypothetical protein